MTEPTNSGVPATPVSGDVPADEPIAPPPVAEAGEQAESSADPATLPEPAPPAEPEPAPPAEPEPAPAAEPEPAPVAPPEPAPVVPPEPAPAVPPDPAPVVPPAPPAEPPTEPAPPAVPEPVTPDPAPATPPPAEPVTPTLDAGLAGAAATTTELAPHPAVPEPDGVYDDEPASAAGPRRGVLVGAGAALLVLLVVGALLVTAGPVADWRAAQRLADRRADALNESRQLAINLVSIDYRNLDRDLERISSSTTGQARQEFDEKILQNESYKNLVRENEAVITSKIQRIGLEPCGTEDRECLRGDRAVVLVFLDQESKNKLRTTPRVDRNRVALTVVRRGDSWLVSEVKVV